MLSLLRKCINILFSLCFLRFWEPLDAILWCLSVQSALLHYDWDQKVFLINHDLIVLNPDIDLFACSFSHTRQLSWCFQKLYICVIVMLELEDSRDSSSSR